MSATASIVSATVEAAIHEDVLKPSSMYDILSRPGLQAHSAEKAGPVEFIECPERVVAQSRIGWTHIILDSSSVRKVRSVQAWPTSHPRVNIYFLPCYVPRLNPVEKV